MKDSIFTKVKEKKIWIPVAMIIIFILYMFIGGVSDVDVLTYKVEAKEFVQKVSMTGKVIAAKNVDMAFEVSGRVKSVNIKVGDFVKKGTILASLSNEDYVASVQKNIAVKSSEYAKLQDIISGTKKEEIKLAEDNLTISESDLKIAEQSLLDQVRDTYGKIDELIHFNIDPSFRNPRSSNPEFLYLIDQNPILHDSIQKQRIILGETLSKSKSVFTIDELSKYRKELSLVYIFVNDVNTAISIVAEKTNSTDVSYNAGVATNKTNISLARTTLFSTIANLNQSEVAYKNSLNALTRAKNQLNIATSNATPEKISIQQANVDGASAGIVSSEAQLARTLIRAPFAGIITKVDIKEGEISSPNTPVVSMLNDGEYQIETFVSENDISKIKVGQLAKATLDAYGRDIFFDAVVISVDPSETLKDGVSTYRTKIQFVGKNEKVKSGMTANIEIETDKRSDVLQIPQTAVILESGVKKVKVLTDISCVEKNTCSKLSSKDTSIVLVSIKTGEISSTGDIEILSGIKEGQTIIYSIK